MENSQKMRSVSILLSLYFISSIQNTECLKLRPNVSQCSDESLYKRLDSTSTFTALASLPGEIL